METTHPGATTEPRVTTHRQVSSARWALDVVRDLRAAPSTDEAMIRVTAIAQGATGCAAADLIETRPSAKVAGEPAAASAVARLGGECLATESSRGAAGLAAHEGWDDVLMASEPADVELGDDESLVLMGCYLPNGAGRRPAALVLSFDGQLAPEPGVIERVQAYSELADGAIGYRFAAEQIASLRAALETNREIGTAMGILMATRRVSDDEAFDLLRSESQRSRRKLGAVAAEVVYAGTLPK